MALGCTQSPALHKLLRQKRAGEARGQARRVGADGGCLAFCSPSVLFEGMGGAAGSSLNDMLRKGGGQGHVALECPRCRRRGAIRLIHVEQHCRQRGLRPDWYVAIRLFRCGSCGTRPVKVWFNHQPAPLYTLVPLSVGVPIGVSPRAWHATDDERKRKELIRRARG